MGNYHELVSSTRVMLDGSNYGLWKSRMRSTIRGIDAMAWKSVTTGWSEPKAKDVNGVESNKEEELWTETELKMAKFNSRALSAIQTSVTKKHIELIQGCETAKEAWEILQTHFEGTSKVKSSRLDYLASKFENLKMGESESVEEFSSQLSGIAHESLVMGKKYKDKKLVKKFLRCLPSKYTAYKAAMSVSLNTDEISFDEVVGMLRAHEMEIDGGKKGKGVALVSQDSDDKEDDDDPVSMLVRRFDRVLHRSESGQRRGITSQRAAEGEKRISESEKNDHKRLSVMSARGMDITKLIVQLFGGDKSSATSAKELDTLNWNASTIRRGDVRNL